MATEARMKMTPTRTAVSRNSSTGRRWSARLAAGRAMRLLLALFALVLVTTHAVPAQAGPPFFLVYAVPQGNGALDPSSFPLDGGGMPILPTASIPVGAGDVFIDVFFHNWANPPASSTSPCDPVPAENGDDVTGDEVCGWHQIFVANNGLQISSFSAASSDVKSLLTNDSSVDTLSVTGGTPSAAAARGSGADRYRRCECLGGQSDARESPRWRPIHRVRECSPDVGNISDRHYRVDREQLRGHHRAVVRRM